MFLQKDAREFGGVHASRVKWMFRAKPVCLRLEERESESVACRSQMKKGMVQRTQDERNTVAMSSSLLQSLVRSIDHCLIATLARNE